MQAPSSLLCNPRCKSSVAHKLPAHTARNPAAPVCASYRVRYGRLPDVEGVAHVCGEAFGSGNFPGLNNPELDALEERYMASIAKGVREKLQSALERKRQASLLHRELRLRRTTLQLQEALGKRRLLSRSISLEDRRNERKWVRQRMFTCLVAECEETGEVVGTVSMSMMQPEALLPAPFPSTVPYRAYLYNMGVLTGHRRKGVAKALVQACMRTARLWGADSLWLHVRATREKALDLYMKQGFRPPEVATPLPTVKSLMGETLLKVDLEPWRCSSVARAAAFGPQAVIPERPLAGSTSLRGASRPSQASEPASMETSSNNENLVVDGQVRQDGVFIWDISEKESDEVQQETKEHEQLVRASK
ncbi:acyl-CoA N-acyltransferase [Dunaliella salina]|uniref:Acyl-CoA N-acyltransferase n=1 Tax=Dunaliella salina TaxID=3046 RepID=A0ABQ7GQ97_DUNSA|nr:acyl-CoA N-acyltransferase [Dunaliella salina]|eukprot:KAF5836785.1 acyl-CoA N-acyltransferase [Dunaliella salina]